MKIIELKTGERIEAQAVQNYGQRYVIRTKAGGMKTLQAEAVKAIIDAPKPPPVLEAINPEAAVAQLKVDAQAECQNALEVLRTK